MSTTPRHSSPPALLRVEDIASHPQFRPLASLQGVLHDLRYASSNNFAGVNLYGTLNCAWLRREAADGLEQAAQWLQQQRPGWRILVLDALRPQRVQEAIWKDVEGTPAQSYFADPGPGSIHSWGLAVDCTLLDDRGNELDMGSGYDEMHERSHPELHPQLLASGALQLQHVQRRDLLLAAMQHGGFSGIDNEWWHFDCGDRQWVRRTLARVY
jgi:zinc D-Ala-D-Ala dipeptidase